MQKLIYVVNTIWYVLAVREQGFTVWKGRFCNALDCGSKPKPIPGIFGANPSVSKPNQMPALIIQVFV